MERGCEGQPVTVAAAIGGRVEVAGIPLRALYALS